MCADLPTRRVVVPFLLTHFSQYPFSRGVNFYSILATSPALDVALCVDPDIYSACTNATTSDAFFAANRRRFDLVFVDGLHEATQTYRDVLHALHTLHDGGTVVMHDCNPSHPSYATYPYPTRGPVFFWNGDVYRAVVALSQHADLDVVVVDVDHGVGVVRKRRQQRQGRQETDMFPPARTLSRRWQQRSLDVAAPLDANLSWADFVAYRRDHLQLVTVAGLATWLGLF